MYKYKFNANNTGGYEFESNLYLPEIEVMIINGVSMLFFEDAQIGINLAELKGIEIDGQTYEVPGYRV
ncbi:hypothetical protein CSE16_11820 [Solibacillus sp. R5-41]|uniref:hypothetical protein n=1 Tax=Solibacillus sp. R5-41 TaxID=2048654 RepID=UPI000C1249B7|nr:hypothetical protein [Solibacillus sp. R5-41]ATP40679.1 hypothetical protein CSE16_11820 [Solibacillus sp. R5-41]